MALQTEPDFVVVGEATSGKQAVDLVQQLRPDVVIMNINMPQNGIDATRQIAATCSDVKDVKVVGFSIYNSHERKAKELLGAGASVYLTKGSSFDQIVAAIRTVVSQSGP